MFQGLFKRLLGSFEFEREAIYVAGYPKTGTTWLTRLLASVLDCPSGACQPELDSTEPATGGEDRPGPYVVRKGHFWPVMNTKTAEAVPMPHRISLDNVSHKVVVICRDPRDTAVSLAKYKGISCREAISGMGTGTFWNLPSFTEYYDHWGELCRDGKAVMVHYEQLHYSPVHTMLVLCDMLGVWPAIPIETAVKQNSIEAMKKHVKKHGDRLPGGKNLNMALFRNGRVGEHAEVFSDEDHALARSYWDEWLKKSGVVK